MANEPKHSRISAIVLAAGESRRMGSFKPLLPFQGRTIIEAIVCTLRQCTLEEILVVLGHRAAEIEAQLADYPVKIVHNAQYRRGMLSSVQAGIEQAKRHVDAYLICLGDQPSLQRQTFERLVAAFERAKPGIYLPTYRGQSGHPLLFAAHYRQEIEKLDEAIGLKQLLQRHPNEVQRVEVDTPEMLEDIDTPEDYRRLSSARSPLDHPVN
jgi:molybdenum cofactor cytidylyltransferase